MTCRNVQNSLSAHLDGYLSGEGRQFVLQHLSGCPDCTMQFERLTLVREAVGKLPVAVPPPHLTSMLSVMASQERKRRLVRMHPFRHYSDRFRLWLENLMRPLALPLAGGLISAMLLFGMLVPTFTFHRNLSSNDVPVALFTEPAVKAQNSLGLPDDDLVVEVMLDWQGRVIDYTIIQGPSLNSEQRRAIENKLLFMEFTPATAFGVSTVGKLYLSFNRTNVTVKS